MKNFSFGNHPCSITANEKVLAKCGEFEELEVQEFTNEADAFSILLTYKKMQN